MVIGRDLLRLLLLGRRTAQHLLELGEEDWLCHKGRHTGRPCLLLDVRPVIGGQDDDRRIRSDHIADSADRLDAVHIRHHPVNDVGGKCAVLLKGLLRPHHRFLAAGGPVCLHADFAEHFADAHACVDVVVCNQCPCPLQLRDRLAVRSRLSCKPAVQRYNEFAAPSLFTAERDGALHHIDDVLGNGQAQAGSLNAAFRNRPLSCKGIKNMLLERRVDADSVIPNSELIGCIAFSAAFALDDAHIDRSADRRELHGIAHDIQEHLIQPELVRENVLMHHVLRIDEQILLLGADVALNDGPQIVHDIRQVNLGLLDLDASVLDPAHVQDIVDQA